MDCISFGFMLYPESFACVGLSMHFHKHFRSIVPFYASMICAESDGRATVFGTCKEYYWTFWDVSGIGCWKLVWKNKLTGKV